jgi:hypothetical protein
MIKIIENFPDINNYAEDVYFTIGSYKLNLPLGDDEFCASFCNHSYITDKCFGIHNSSYIDKKKLLNMYPDLINILLIIQK